MQKLTTTHFNMLTKTAAKSNFVREIEDFCTQSLMTKTNYLQGVILLLG